MNEEQLIEEIDGLIKKGKQTLAVRKLKSIKLSEMSRENRLHFSNLSRRAQQPLFALKILSKPIKAHKINNNSASVAEIFSYCQSLIKLGFYRETESWLSQIDGELHPQFFDLKGRVAVAQWNYSLAARFFRRYLEKIDRKSYSYLVGSLNHSYSLLYSNQFQKARNQINETRRMAYESNSSLILANCHELNAQLQIKFRNFQKATQHMERGLSIIGHSSSIWAFYVKKLAFEIQSLQKGPSPEVIHLGDSLAEKARSMGYFEEVRDIDSQLATLTQDEEKLWKVYFGTHYSYGKSRILESFQKLVPVPREFEITLFGNRGEAVDFSPDIFLQDHPKLKKLFKILTTDLYRPLSMGYVFDNLYDEPHFDPEHTPERIYALVKRLRAKISSPYLMDIDWDAQGLRLQGNRPIRLQIHRSLKEPTPNTQAIRKLRKHFGKKWFTSQEVCQVLDMSPTSARRNLRAANDHYKILRSGNGKSTRYRFK